MLSVMTRTMGMCLAHHLHHPCSIDCQYPTSRNPQQISSIYSRKQLHNLCHQVLHLVSCQLGALDSSQGYIILLCCF